MGKWPTERHASPQAWRRLRTAVTNGELRDVAADVAAWTGGDADEIAFALTSIDWEPLRQSDAR